MGFNSVYRCLQEVFPQIDARILKAVAIENSKDADAAVNDVLTEVLPYMVSAPDTDSKSVEVTNVPSERSSTIAVRKEESSHRNSSFDSDTIHLYMIDEAGPSSGLKTVENSENGKCSDGNSKAKYVHLDEVVNLDPSLGQSSGFVIVESNGSINGCFRDDSDISNRDKVVNDSEVSGAYAVNGGLNHLTRSKVNEEPSGFVEKIWEGKNEKETVKNAGVLSTLWDNKGTDDQNYIGTVLEASISCDKINGIVGDEQTSLAANPSLMNAKENNDPKPESDCSVASNVDPNLPEMNCNVHQSINGLLFDHTQVVAELVLPSVQSHTEDVTECNLQSGLNGNTPAPDYEELRASGSMNVASEKGDSVSETGYADGDFTKLGTFTESAQICSTDFLDEIIEDAKNNKKTLFSAMESVMNLMKEVELQERDAERAKEEAAMGGLDILVKVEELKQMLAHAKEGNDMHAGEVYGEKAILATEVRELQSRLLCLSEERDKSLATLDKMRRSLEERLAAAEEMKKEAEQEKLKKEESARKALAEQEAIMEKVVQESKMLEQEAEQNSKLREFLVDRGAIMDMLQGEISVICQDVSLLKEKFDNRVPLSLSVSSSQTTCKLASSGSSIKSASSVVSAEERQSPKSSSVVSAEERESPKSPEKGSLDSSIGDLTPKICNEEYLVNSIDNEHVDDGWEIFEKDAELDI